MFQLFLDAQYNNYMLEERYSMVRKCPRCGTSDLSEQFDPQRMEFKVRCNNCGCTMSVSDYGYDSMEVLEVLAEWHWRYNKDKSSRVMVDGLPFQKLDDMAKRVVMRKKADGMECPLCGGKVEIMFERSSDTYTASCPECDVEHAYSAKFFEESCFKELMDQWQKDFDGKCRHGISQVKFEVDGDRCCLVCERCGERFVSKVSRYEKVGLNGLLKEWRDGA